MFKSFFQGRCAYLVVAAIGLFLGVLILGGCEKGPTPLPGDRFYEEPATEVTILFNGNDLAVMNGPTAPTVFSISGSYLITLITNYHWNSGQGKPAGTIALTSASGQVYGPWSVTTRSNVYWDVTPNVVIPAGTYTVIDSDPATWSQNSQSNGQGMSTVKGILQ